MLALNTERRMEELVRLFGSGSEIARIAGVDRAAVSRWRSGQYRMGSLHQVKLLKEAKRRKLNVHEVANLLAIHRCPHCHGILNDEVRKVLR